ncbi:hypothetical protein [Hymenobacter arizonensis]|uniref:Uncharacterized protein n=1 Tax=Hymenobacter arizonensis TaxID=1227077 RepID=A0A1I5ZC94_HYMAR|nr:hypothetical protein [Hymenobacter arizonensis]SFQ53757.1 hypothetical protein SAMN04515668_2903 [Hymenobacter arizonensis]
MNTQNTPNPPDNDFRPEDQQERAAAARPNPNDPIINAHSPNYGEFGGIDPNNPVAGQAPSVMPTNQQAGRDGSNDNPDEFSEFRDREKDARDAPANPEDQPGHVEQNQNPAAVRATQDENYDEQKAAWALDDPRYAGGGTHNTRDESASTKSPEDN